MAATGMQPGFSLLGKLIERMKALSERIAQLSELRGIDDAQLGQIASEFGMSRRDLYALCGNKAPTGDLLRRRMAEFGLTEEALARRHPDVLHDLQRVCGTCATTSRCAHDFAAHRDSGRDRYCPNTCTLFALKQEGLPRKA